MIGAIDIGGTKVAVGAVREDGILAHHIEAPTNSGQGFEPAMEQVRRMLQEIVDACGPLAGIGIACPGPLNPFTGIIGDVGTLPGWKGGNLNDALREFGVPVAVENDADAAALAEYSCGTGRGAGSFIYLTISTGIGGGIVLGGQLYRGVDGAHPELGHQVIDNAGPLCYCSARGCWESLASGTAMSAWMSEKRPDAPALSAAAICECAVHEDELAMQAVKREGYYLGLGLANLVTLFAPDVIALGGGVMKSSHLFMDDALKVVRNLCTQVPVEKTRITISSLGSEAGLLGAAQSWLLRYKLHAPGSRLSHGKTGGSTTP
jgi:glucokinase